jgi:photosystem II stability/assembly factor-like uncharacterized protein
VFLPVIVNDYTPEWRLAPGLTDRVYALGVLQNGQSHEWRTYAGSGSKGVYISASGKEFEHSGLSDRFVPSLLVTKSPSEAVYAGTFLHGVFRTTDGGQTWPPFNDGLPPDSIIWALDMAAGPRLLAAADTAGIYYRNLPGTEWKRPADNITVALSLRTHPTITTTVYAGGEDGLYTSTDRGQTWGDKEDTSPCPRNIWAIAVVGENLYIGADDGLCYRPLAGGAWKSVQGIASTVYALTTYGNNKIAVGTAEQGVWQGSASTFEKMNGGLPDDVVVYALIQRVNGILLAGTDRGVYLMHH